MKKLYVLLTTIFMLLVIGLFVFKTFYPKKIGLVTNLESERNDFVTSSIMGARIAEIELNNKVGFFERKIKLIVINDDFKDPNTLIKNLKNQRINTIITTNNSESLMLLKNYFDKTDISVFSVNAATSNLSNIRDNVYKIYPDNKAEIGKLKSFLDKEDINKNFGIIYNKSDSENLISTKKCIESIGGNVIFQDSSYEGVLAYKVIDLEKLKECSVLLILMPSRDTGFLCQKLRNYGYNGLICGLSNSGDPNLLIYGGKDIEKFVFVSPIDFEFKDKDASTLNTKLNIQYGKVTSLVSEGAYKAVNLINECENEKYKKHITFSQAIDSIGFFNSFGDSKNKEYIYMVIDGKFCKLED